MLSNANLGQELWEEVVSTTCYLINRSPSMEIDCKILEEVWTGHSYDYSNLKIFGCEAYAFTPKNQRSKLDLDQRSVFLLDMVMSQKDIDFGILLPTRSSLEKM